MSTDRFLDKFNNFFRKLHIQKEYNQFPEKFNMLVFFNTPKRSGTPFQCIWCPAADASPTGRWFLSLSYSSMGRVPRMLNTCPRKWSCRFGVTIKEKSACPLTGMYRKYIWATEPKEIIRSIILGGYQRSKRWG